MGTVYVFTDASQEGSQGLDMGLGCVAYDDQGRLLSWFGAKVDSRQAAILTQGKQKVINELESLAVALSFPLLRQHIAGRHVVFYLGARLSTLELLAGVCGVLEAEVQCIPWYGRVPSKSNPADAPSKPHSAQAAQKCAGVGAG